MSRRVLLICYYFPPLGLGGVGRPLNLFKRLPRQGWTCDILTVKPVLYRAYEPELLNGLDASRIHRAGSYDPQRLLYLLGMRKVKPSAIGHSRHVTERIFPDSKVGWVGPAVRMGKRLQRTNGYDVMVTTSPPMSCHLIGLKLAHRLGIPWVADFRDFWTIYPAEQVFADESRRARARRLLDRITTESRAITAVNRSIVDYLGAGELVPNGFDPEVAELWRTPPPDRPFTIGLLGHQHDTREIEPLLILLDRLRSHRPDYLTGVRILQVGQIDAVWFRRTLAERGFSLELDIRQRQTREETVRILSQAHVFFLGISDKEGPGFLPGRTFELIASGRPVFAYAGPDSEVARVVGPSFGACCFHDDSYETAAEKLASQLESLRGGGYRYEPLSDYARQFSADELSKKFAVLLDRVI